MNNYERPKIAAWPVVESLAPLRMELYGVEISFHPGPLRSENFKDFDCDQSHIVFFGETELVPAKRQGWMARAIAWLRS